MSWYVGYDSNNVLQIIGDSPSLPNEVGVTVIPVAYAVPAWAAPNFRLVKWNSSTLVFDDLPAPDPDPGNADQTEVQRAYQNWRGEHQDFWL